MQTYKIAVFGSLTADLFIQPSESQIITKSSENFSESLFALPHGGKVSANHIQEHFGGGSSNVSISFSRFGHQVFCFGGIGDDANGEKILKNLHNENIITTEIQKFSGKKSGFSLILNSFDGERTVIFTAEANQEFSEIKKNILIEKHIDALYLCHLSGENSKKIFSQIEMFLEQNLEKKFFWNPGKESIERGIEKNSFLLKSCDILFLNTEEAEKFSGISAKTKHSYGYELRNKDFFQKNFQKTNIPDSVKDVSEIAEIFLEKGVKNVVITDGRNGAQAFSQNKNEKYEFIPCISGNRIDTLGAGDSFASTFSSFFLRGNPLKKCGKYASINAASVISFQGAQDGLLNFFQIENSIT